MVNEESELSWFEAQVWIRAGAKGDRLLQQPLMQNGEPEAKVVGILFSSRKADQLPTWGLNCFEHVYLHPKLPIQLESPVASFHVGDQLRSRPIPRVCTAHSPCRAPELHTLGCSLTLQTWTLPGLGCCCPSPQSSHCELSTGRSVAGERALCHQVQKGPRSR